MDILLRLPPEKLLYEIIALLMMGGGAAISLLCLLACFYCALTPSVPAATLILILGIAIAAALAACVGLILARRVDSFAREEHKWLN